MKKIFITLSLVTSTFCIHAADAIKPLTVPFHQLPKAEQEARIVKAQKNRLIRTGGEITKPGSQKGKILFINGQSLVSTAEIDKVVNALVDRTRLNIAVSNSAEKITLKTAGEIKEKFGADIAVFVTACDECPIMLLVAPEDGWAIVNTLTLVKDAKNDIFTAARFRKEVQRAFYSVAGAMNSQYPNSLMRAVRAPSDLDKIGEGVPMDVLGRTMENLANLGVMPLQRATYLQACKQGWAPAPTNEVQKAIWDKVHELPTNPIKIKYDPKRDK